MSSDVTDSGADENGNPEKLADLQNQIVGVQGNLANSERYKINIKARDFMHWSRSTLLSSTNKKTVWQLIAGRIPSHMWKQSPEGKLGVGTVTFKDVQRIGKTVGLPYCSKCLMPPQETDVTNVPTCGKWFYRSCNQLAIQQLDRAGHLEGTGAFENYKVAYHGTALRNVAAALTKGIEPGASHFENHYGVYCEGGHRQSSIWNYMTHESLDSEHPLLLYAAMFELLVDRTPNIGRTHHFQWIQRKDSVIFTGVYIHVFNVLDVFTPMDHGGSMSGWLRVADSSVLALQQLSLTPQSDTKGIQDLQRRVFG